MNRHTLARLARPALLIALFVSVMLLGLNGAAWANTSAQPLEHSTVPKPSDISVKKEGPRSAKPGSIIHYTIEVKNRGKGPAQNVTMTDTLPPELTFVSVTTKTGTCTSGQTVTCSLGTMNSNRTIVIHIRAQVDPSFNGTITNTASVTTTSPDTNFGNNSSSRSTRIK